MKVAVLSDSHDNIWNLERVLRTLRMPVCSSFAATSARRSRWICWGGVAGPARDIRQQ